MPGSNPLTEFVADATVYAPGPSPTVMLASAAWVSVAKPPTLSLNADASMFSPLFAPAVFDVSCRRYALFPTCTAVAVTPAPAALIALTTVARLPSPVLTLAPVSVPVRRPPESAPVIVPPAATFNTRLCPASRLLTVCAVPPSTLILPSAPVAADASVDRPSAASALPPVTWIVAALPSRVVAIESFPEPRAVALISAPAAVAASCTALVNCAAV